METSLDKYLYRNPDNNKLYLRNWKCFFPHIIQTNEYKMPEKDEARLFVINSNYCIADADEKPVYESAISEADIIELAEIIDNLQALYCNYQFKTLPRFKIGLMARDKFFEQKDLRRQAELDKKVTLEFYQPQYSFSDDAHGSCHIPKRAGDWCNANSTPLKFIYPPFWYHNEICILFADSNVGKSLFASQIALQIAHSHKIIYFDYELTTEAFKKRFSHNGKIYPFPDNFIRAEVNLDSLIQRKSPLLLIRDIERIIKTQNPKAIIIDNLTFIVNKSNDQSAATVLMYHLKVLKERYNIAILVVAHTGKRKLCNPITQNDMAGSKLIFNFADSVMAMAKSLTQQDQDVVYLKQLKSRNDRIEFHDENVILLRKDFSDGYLKFSEIGRDSEKNHLSSYRKFYKNDLKKKISILKAQNFTQNAICEILEISRATLNRYLADIPKNFSSDSNK